MRLAQWLRLLALISVDAVQFQAKAAVFLIVSLSEGLSLRFMCSDQHVNSRMPSKLARSLLLDYHIKHARKYTQLESLIKK